MIEASPSPRGPKAARLPHFAVPDRAVAARPVPQDRHADAGVAVQAPYDPVDYSGTDAQGPIDNGQLASVHERGGYAGASHAFAAPPIAVTRDAADLDDLSHSLGDGARRAVDVAAARFDTARTRRDAAAAQAAMLRLQQALNGVRRVCVHAMRQRMHTEMADLASQIRKMHDGDAPPR